MKLATSIGALILAGAALSGCAKEQRRVSSDEEGIVVANRVGIDEVRPSVDAFCKAVSEKNAKGWQKHIKMGEDGKPTIVIKTIQNRTHDPHFDVVRLTNEVKSAILEQDICHIIMAGTAAGEGVEEARDYSAAGTQTSSADVKGGKEDEWSLILTGTITSEVKENDDVTQYDYEFYLELTDTVKKQLVLTSKPVRFRKEKER